jgi:hypothetical protein
LVENSNQCNILGIHVKDLEKELDILKDQVDENSNNIQSNMFETMSHGKGKRTMSNYAPTFIFYAVAKLE